MTGQQQPPNGGQVPDYRLQEMAEQLRRLDEENRRMRGMLDQVAARPVVQQPPPQEERLFDEPVDRALDKKMQKAMTPVVEQFKNQIGMLYDQNDLLRFQQMYGADTYDKYKDKVERIREERQRFGQYVSREDAYKHVFYEETSKKAGLKPEPPVVQPQATGPQIDPYTGMLMNPAPAQEQAPALPPLQGQQTQPPTQPGFNPQQAPAPQAPPQAPSFPTLPPAGMSPATTTQPPANPSSGPLSIGADIRDLDAWANKYGDIPL